MLASSRLFSYKQATYLQAKASAPSRLPPQLRKTGQAASRQHQSRSHSKMSIAGFFSGLFGGNNDSKAEVEALEQHRATSSRLYAGNVECLTIQG